MVTMPDPRRLSPETMLTTDDASPVLSRFSHCGGRKSGFVLFWLKNLFCNPFFYPKHPRNHDKPIHDLKKPPKNQTQSQTKNQLELRFVFSWTFKIQKHLIWTPRIKWNNLTQKLSFWWSKSVPTTNFFFYR